MRDDGKRPIAVGSMTEHLELANEDRAHIVQEFLDQHPLARRLIEERERVAFLAGVKSQMQNHTTEFAERAALLAYARWVASQ